jgi:predicted phage gp36 major capsid-like protein
MIAPSPTRSPMTGDPCHARASADAADRRDVMALSDQQRKFYENIMATTRQEIEELNRLIEEETAKVRDRIAELQNAKKASRQMYDAACMRLGVSNDLPDDPA